MITLALNLLTPEQIRDIEELMLLCSYFSSYYEPESADGHNCFFLAYENDGRLAGFVSYLPVAQNHMSIDAELTGIVHPDFRNQGIFKTLLHMAIKELDLYQLSYHLYCALGPEYLNISSCQGFSHSEYLLNLDIDTARTLVLNHSNMIYTTKNLLHMEQKAFTQRFTLLKKEKTFFSPRPIGRCHLYKGEKHSTIFGVKIKKPYRGKGYGFQLMLLVIYEYFKKEKNPLKLHVSGINIPAYRLYRSCGFQVTEQRDYYTLMSRNTGS